jgi:hypothetical protein
MKSKLKRFVREFEEDNEEWDGTVRLAFTEHPKNTDPSEILLKVVVLNIMYSAGLWRKGDGYWKMAERIQKSNADRRLDACDFSLVDDLGKKINNKACYVFATKYCHWSRPSDFPLQDSLSTRAAHYLSRKLSLGDNVGFKVTYSNLWGYERYKRVLDELVVVLDLPDSWKYKKLDEGLYYLGKGLG